MLKGTKRSFVVVLVLGVESSSKNVTILTKNDAKRTENATKGTKNVRKQKMFADKNCSKFNRKS